MSKENRPVLWLFMAELNHPDLCYALPATAWAAEQLGVKLECYLESVRQGNLFAQTGSTVIGGHHHQQFNYLHAIFDVKLLVLGSHTVFASSTELFSDEVLIDAPDLSIYYDGLMSLGAKPKCTLYAPRTITVSTENTKEDYGALMHNAPIVDSETLDIIPYIHSEIFFRRALAYPSEWLENGEDRKDNLPAFSLWMKPQEGIKSIEEVQSNDDFRTMTLRIANRWKKSARAVAFGDPDAIRAQLPALCRESRVSLFAPKGKKNIRDVKVALYTENRSPVARETALLARELGEPVIVGRQTGDADLFEWGKFGVSIKIMDPNRPAFPVVDTVKHKWANIPGTIWDEEPDDKTLRQWAREGRVLSSLIFHSGEMAHNEAMLNLIDLCSVTGLKLGIAALLSRYQTCPQQWELLQIPVSRGGVRGRIEPLLHCGGMGIMAEFDCPEELLKENCVRALNGIREIAGDNNVPMGYYAFCDTDLDTLQQTKPRIYHAIKEAGLEYCVSSVHPGRNRLVDAPIPVLTQTSRTQCQGSPFVRITSVEDIRESGYQSSPGWFLGVLDSPVIAFNPYIWKKGGRFMDIVDFVCHERMINVLPRTIARYAVILKEMGYLP